MFDFIQLFLLPYTDQKQWRSHGPGVRSPRQKKKSGRKRSKKKRMRKKETNSEWGATCSAKIYVLAYINKKSVEFGIPSDSSTTLRYIYIYIYTILYRQKILFFFRFCMLNIVAYISSLAILNYKYHWFKW